MHPPLATAVHRLRERAAVALLAGVHPLHAAGLPEVEGLRQEHGVEGHDEEAHVADGRPERLADVRSGLCRATVHVADPGVGAVAAGAGGGTRGVGLLRFRLGGLLDRQAVVDRRPFLDIDRDGLQDSATHEAATLPRVQDRHAVTEELGLQRLNARKLADVALPETVQVVRPNAPVAELRDAAVDPQAPGRDQDLGRLQRDRLLLRVPPA
mmetsp:Transcript_62160/g.175241  ORF Transcript_62160/g.175241 Transcript_62160/m.175241 type:complete len:211 (-) Transcript_62160:1799-2431(-)